MRLTTSSLLLALSLALTASFSSVCYAQTEDLNHLVIQAMPKLEKLYLHLHQNPELSYHEQATAARIAKELSTLGFEVTKDFGGHDVHMTSLIGTAEQLVKQKANWKGT